MALKRLTSGEMIHTTQTWVDPKHRHQQLLSAVAEVAVLLNHLERAHQALLTLQPVTDPSAAGRARALEDLAAQHDDLVRAMRRWLPHHTGGASAGTGGAGGATSSGTGGATTSGAGGSGGAPGIMSCAEIGADDCFSNLDCLAADRCEDQGGASLAVPCCVPGMRGTGVLGDPCSIDDDCATSLCIETPGGYLCSGECTQPADCIPALPDCTKIPAILGKGAFCLPP